MAYNRKTLNYDYSKIPIATRPTICWTYKRSTGKEEFRGCEWFDHAIPVAGWNATKRYIRKDRVETYRVHECPKYIYDDELELFQTSGKCPHIKEEIK